MASGGSDKKKDVDPNRRAILVGGAAAVAGVAAGIVIGGNVFPKELVKEEVQTVKEVQTVTETVPQTVVETVTVPLQYQKQKVANISQLSSPGSNVLTTYMGYNVIIVKTGVPSLNGVGPDHDIVGFSTVCPHMGYAPLVYNSKTNCLVCTQHFSQFDLTVGGQQVIGHANQYLPQLYLEYDESTGDIYAVGFNRLVYGVYDNIAQAPAVSSSSSSSS